MKLKHNKKRNTAFIYEVLIKELSKATMNNDQQKKIKVVKILKEYFTKNSPLKDTLEIYKSFNDLPEMDEGTIQKLISEARYQASNLDKGDIFNKQTKIINEINKQFGLQSWDTFIKNYKKIATINQVVFGKVDPKRQVFLEQKLINMLGIQDEVKQPFPNINNLALKGFIAKFNNEYEDNLNEHQKKLLNKYITSTSEDESEFKMYLYNEIDRIKHALKENITNKKEYSEKFKIILEKINNYSHKKLDRNMITEIIKIQSLVGELKDDRTN